MNKESEIKLTVPPGKDLSSFNRDILGKRILGKELDLLLRFLQHRQIIYSPTDTKVDIDIESRSEDEKSAAIRKLLKKENNITVQIGDQVLELEMKKKYN